MRGIVFSGPSLPRAMVEAVAGLAWRPPLRQGDLYRAAIARPAVIGVVDGFFENTPTVWHKEILWAMSQGIHVYGAASIGALRAAELSPFGMQGVGLIFEMFRDGILQDDDEVAVLHAPQELDWAPLTEAMVNVRATLAAGQRCGAIRPDVVTTLSAIAKALFYKERTYDAILAIAGERGLPQGQARRLTDWLPAHRVDQKRLDAMALLEQVGTLIAEGTPPFLPSFRFVRTSAWAEATASPPLGEPP
jgi:hypothetical protein